MNRKLSQLSQLSGRAFALGAALWLAACATAPVTVEDGLLRTQAVNAEPGSVNPQVVTETFVSTPLDGIELDTPATWFDANNKPWVIVTGKGSHQLAVFDGTNGELFNIIGEKGSEPGKFKRPNGVAVFRNLLLVTERDNHRVQVMRLPDFKPILTFGEDQLQAPYGIWLNPTGSDRAILYVTDSFMEGRNFDVFPDPNKLNRRVQAFEIRIENGELSPAWLGSFGSTAPATALHRVESLSGNPTLKTLLIVDEEDKQKKSTLREYSFDGQFTGNSIDNRWVQGQAEGIAHLQCRDSDYWIVVDQLAPHTIFHVFGAKSLVYQGSFRGETTSLTDGIELNQHRTAMFPNGALYAIDRDRSLTAFDLTDIVNQLKLPTGCLN